MRRFIFIASIVFTIGIVALLCYNYIVFQDAFFFFKGEVIIDKIICEGDLDNDGISDMDDIVQGARLEIFNHTKYQSNYYEGGYPPQNEGVCTDVIWRALKNAGYDLKANIDKDILENIIDYSKGVVTRDSNIDFRRVKNQTVFFKKYATSLTTEVKPYNKRNLFEWQAGDIVVLRNSEHVAIISDRRRKDGVPFVLHNASTYAKEENTLMRWVRNERIIGHYRFPIPKALIE
jgi:uncharacterized protein